jgi:polygalacturonase
VTDTWRFVPESVWNDIEDGLVSNAVNIEDYGAVADSTGATGNGTDNTTAIAAAITAASTRG